MPASKTDPEATGVLYRAQQKLPSVPDDSFLRGDLDARGQYMEGLPLEPLARGILWLDVRLLPEDSGASLNVGTGPGQARRAWDARGLGRPQADLAEPNSTAVDRPLRSEDPILPRRILLTMELELPKDLVRRPRLVEPLDREANRFEVTRGDRLPRKAGAFLRIGSEWVRVQRIEGGCAHGRARTAWDPARPARCQHNGSLWLSRPAHRGATHRAAASGSPGSS